MDWLYALLAGIPIWGSAGYMLRRWIEGHAQDESYARDLKQLEIAKALVDLHDRATSLELEVYVPLENVTSEIDDGDDSTTAFMRLAVATILQPCFNALAMERIAAKHPDCQPELQEARERFVDAYDNLNQAFLFDDRKALKQFVHCYYGFVHRQTAADAEAFIKAIENLTAEMATEPEDDEQASQ